MIPPNVDGLPPLQWTHHEGEIADAPGIVLIAGSGTDWTNDATGDGAPSATPATSLAFVPGDGDFVFSARVSVDDPRTTFDAAVLTARVDDHHWAKLCFERSPQGEDMVVSVVTNEYSDDANGPVIHTGEVWLRLARLSKAFAFHYSEGRG